MFKNFEIKLNSVQSILLIVSIFAIGALSFALGFIIGKSPPPEVVALKSGHQKDIPNLPKGDVQFPVPLVSEKEVVPTEKVAPKKTDEAAQQVPDAGELTFFKTLPEHHKSDTPQAKEKDAASNIKKAEKKEKEIPQKPASERSEGTARQGTATALAPQPSTQGSKPSYTVQVGSFKTMDDASKLKSKLEGKGYQSYITTYDTQDAKWFRVRIGQFKTKEQAESTAKKLKAEENLATFITAYK